MSRSLDDFRRNESSAFRLLPHDTNAEEALLGAMLVNPRAIEECAPFLAAEDFYRPVNGNIFEALKWLYANNFGTDPVSVGDRLQTEGLLDGIGGTRELMRLFGGSPTITGNAVHHAVIIRRYSRSRSAVIALSSASEAIYLGVDADETLTRLFDTQSGVHGVAGSSWDPEDLTEHWAASSGLQFPPPNLLTRLDGHKLLAPGALGLLVAPPESGKSLLCMAAVVEAAVNERHAVYVDLESRAARVVPRLRQHFDGHLAKPFFNYIDPAAAMQPSDRWRIRKLVSTLDPIVVILDGYNALLAKHKKSGNDASDIAALIEDIVDPWRTDNSSVVLVDHVSKEDNRMARMDPMGSVSKLGLVDWCVYLKRDESARFARGQTGIVDLVIAKDRDGELRGLCADRENFGKFAVKSNNQGRWQSAILMPDTMQAGPFTFRPEQEAHL